jgi:hypothetical protein
MARIKKQMADHAAKVSSNPRLKKQPVNSEDEMPKAKATKRGGETGGRVKKAKKGQS